MQRLSNAIGSLEGSREAAPEAASVPAPVDRPPKTSAIGCVFWILVTVIYGAVCLIWLYVIGRGFMESKTTFTLENIMTMFTLQVLGLFFLAVVSPFRGNFGGIARYVPSTIVVPWDKLTRCALVFVVWIPFFRMRLQLNLSSDGHRHNASVHLNDDSVLPGGGGNGCCANVRSRTRRR